MLKKRIRIQKIAYLIGIMLLICLSSSLFAEVDYDRIEYLFHKNKLDNFQKSMNADMQAYYQPRKRYIDKQSIYPYAGEFYRVYIIKRGSYLRKKYVSKNKKEILKLEEFLQTANDFELNRYFSGDEEEYLQKRAIDSIQQIRNEANKDEIWRHKTDPIFASYLKNRATPDEKTFYHSNLSLFYVEFSGKKRISFLQTLVKNKSITIPPKG